MQHLFYLLALCWLASGCASALLRPAAPTPARPGEVTPTTLELRNLPAPREPLVVAVYQFRDQTGQYKPDGGFSTAVTQGATNILVRTLDESGWFRPIERENLNNLLNERKIIRSTWNQVGVEQALTPLLYASVIFEGGIVGYDSNVLTGGAGVRYFGAGGSEQYRQDRVTVYLRAIDVKTGQVLKTIYTSKTILSQAIDVGLFRYVRFQRLLEFETGVTYNEPSEMAVTEAIEKAVIGMIVEGAQDNLWALNNQGDTQTDLFAAYEAEKLANQSIDFTRRNQNDRRSSFGLTVGSNHLTYQGDYPNPIMKSGGELGAWLTTSPKLSYLMQVGIGQLATAEGYRTTLGYADLGALYRLLPADRLTPFFQAGAGILATTDEPQLNLRGRLFPKLHAGAGLEYLMSERFGLRAAGSFQYLLSDQLDAVDQGQYNDYYWQGNLGITFYFGRTFADKKRFAVDKPGLGDADF